MSKDNGGGIEVCGEEFVDPYGAHRVCGRPPGHEGKHMTWNEYIDSQRQSDEDPPDIPAGD